VEDFTYGDDLEFVVCGNNVYTNKNLEDSIISIGYWRKTRSIVLEVTLNTNEDGYSFFSPEVSVLNLEINGIKVS
jgi:hypothetical protein